jgi:DNA-binding transcriptional LysR family regulator
MNELPRSQALRCFIMIAREGTVSRAAALLHLTQPAVSLQLKALEESTGLQLFNRTPTGFTLTEAGSALLPLARKAVAAMQDFGTAANSLKGSHRPTLRIGTIMDPEFTRLGAFVRSLTASSQRTEVFLRHGVTDDVLAQIGAGELDVGYYVDATPTRRAQRTAERQIDDGRYQLMPLLSYVYRVIAPAEWRGRVTGKNWRDLAQLPWLATPAKSAHRRLLDDIFRPLGPMPKRISGTDQEEAIPDLVESGMCLSLARETALDRITSERNLVVADRVSLSCDLSFVCLASRRDEPTIAHAFRAMQTVWDLAPESAPA